MAYSNAHAVPLLLTSVIATCCEENSEDSVISGSGSPYVIKNTFICVSDSEDEESVVSTKSRRSLSAPPAPRKAHEFMALPEEKLIALSGHLLESQKWSVTSNASTLALEGSEESPSESGSAPVVMQPLSHEDEEEHRAGGSGHPFVIKNTFVCVSDAEDEIDALATPSSRRSCFVPPSPRPPEIANVHDDSLRRSCQPSPTSQRCSVASTSARTDEEDEEAKVEEAEGEVGPATDSDADVTSVDSTNDCVTLSLADLVLASAQRPRTALDTKAKAYRPCSDPPWKSSDIRKQFAAVMGAAESALESSSAVSTVKSSESAASWSVVGVSNLQNLSSLQPVELAVVKQAMLIAAQESSNVYLLGYESTPFINIPGQLGFSAILAYVENEDAACWDLLTKGCCCRGHKCRWQHPLKLLQVSVVLEFQSE